MRETSISGDVKGNCPKLFMEAIQTMWTVELNRPRCKQCGAAFVKTIQSHITINPPLLL